MLLDSPSDLFFRVPLHPKKMVFLIGIVFSNTALDVDVADLFPAVPYHVDPFDHRADQVHYL